LEISRIKDHYDVLENNIHFYRENGHVFLPNVCSQGEINFFRNKIKKASIEKFPKMPSMEERPEDDFSRAFLQTFNLHEDSPELEGFCLSPRFGKIAADLMGVNAVRHYYNKPMFKEPSSWITPWHQDGPHWPITSNNMLTMWIALVDIDYDMGPVRFASKTHKNKYFGPKGITKDTESFYLKYIEENNFEISEISFKAGDVSVHNHWTIHGAGPNNSQSMREVMAITMYEDGLIVDQSICKSEITMMPNVNKEINKEENGGMVDLNDLDQDGIVRDPYLGGRIHGEIADSNRNPILFSYNNS
tara:strand:- start:7181 stop:8089 length:909 start_codon:yes stop_codon:yes gene_type:complete